MRGSTVQIRLGSPIKNRNADQDFLIRRHRRDRRDTCRAESPGDILNTGSSTMARLLLNKVRRKWSGLSLAGKLYAAFGIMAFLIAMELFTLIFAIHTLSAVRAFVGGEG